MKIMNWLQKIHLQIMIANHSDTGESEKLDLMDVAIQRIQQNRQIALFKTDYLE